MLLPYDIQKSVGISLQTAHSAPLALPPVAYSAYARAFLWNPEWDLQLQRIYIMTFVMFCQHRLCIHHAYQSMCKCGPEKCLVICFAELEHLCSNLKY